MSKYDSKIIDRIEIHRFRSIGDESILANEINIFSGKNNSGKSNILRALNLFFNFETSYDSPHDFEKDYNIAYTGQAGGSREISITIHFEPQGHGALKYPFSISRRFKLATKGFETIYASEDKAVQDSITVGNGTITRQFTRFLNSIEFLYIPAVRDKLFVKHLFQNFQQIARDTTGKEIGTIIDELSAIIEDRSKEISKDFVSFLDLPTAATLSSNNQDIFGTIKVEVSSGLQIRKKVTGSEQPSEIVNLPVDLFSSGDGVLMSYIAYFLAHLCRKNPGKRYVWGFEEPENSLEYSKAQKLADEFLTKFKRYAQIFITTHSPAFIKLRNFDRVNFYRVYIEPSPDHNQPDKRLSRVKTLDQIKLLQTSIFGDQERNDEYIALESELGFVEFANEIETAVNELNIKRQDYVTKSISLDGQLAQIESVYPEKIFVIEDSSKVAKQFWERVLGDNIGGGITILCSEGCTNNRVEEHIRFMMDNKTGYKPRVFRQIDRDGLTDDQVQYLEEKNNGIVSGKHPYQVKVLPVYEIENFVVLATPLHNLNEEEKEKIKVAFERSAMSKLRELSNKFPDAPDGLFKKGNDPMPVMQVMRGRAITDWNMLMPGKEIASKIPNFNVKAAFNNMNINNYPNKLIGYVNKIKDFFA